MNDLCCLRKSIHCLVGILVMAGLALSSGVAAYFSEFRPLADGRIAVELNTPPVSAAFRPYFQLCPLERSTDLSNWEVVTTFLKTNLATTRPQLTLARATHVAEYFRTFTNKLITPLPLPSGPYRVGVRRWVLTDLSRTNRYLPTNSSFIASSWYPGEPTAGLVPTRHIDLKLALDSRVWGSTTNLVYEFVSHSLPNIPIARGLTNLPVLLYSHGAANFRQADTETAEALASHGFMVVAVDHVDAGGSEFPDGRYFQGTSPSLSSRVRDLQFALEELERLNNSDPQWQGRLKLDEIGAFGHSYGGGTVGELSRLDKRCIAAVLLDPALYFANELKRSGLSKPFVCMISEIPANFPGWRTDAESLYAMAQSNAYSFQVRGSDHFTFHDGAWGFPTDATRRAAVAITACTLSFFNKYLREIAGENLIDTATNQFPLIFNYQRK